MNKKMLDDLLDLTDKAADAIGERLITLNAEYDAMSAQTAEAAQAAYSLVAVAVSLGLVEVNNMPDLEWAANAVKVFETRRESLEQRIDALVTLNHAEVRYNLSMVTGNDGRPVIRENDPEFERLLDEWGTEMPAKEVW